MKCPRTFQIEITEDSQISLAGAECIKEECPWWNAEQGECDPTGMMSDITDIAASLNQLVNTLPTWRDIKK